MAVSALIDPICWVPGLLQNRLCNGDKISIYLLECYWGSVLASGVTLEALVMEIAVEIRPPFSRKVIPTTAPAHMLTFGGRRSNTIRAEPHPAIADDVHRGSASFADSLSTRFFNLLGFQLWAIKYPARGLKRAQSQCGARFRNHAQLCILDSLLFQRRGHK